MPHTHHPRRAQRLAVCTALALGMGLVSTGPAAATNPAGTGGSPTAQSSTTAQAAAAARAKPRFDRDGDGRGDRVYRSATTGKLAVILSKTSTSASFSLADDDAAKNSSLEVLPADNLVGTPAQDLLRLHPDGTLRLYATTSPTAVDRAVYWQGNGWHIYNKVVAPGDLTKDGRQDLLARTPAGTLYLYAGKGTVADGGPFRTRVEVGQGWQAYDQVVGTNDLDGDTIADLVARTPRGDLYFYKGTGSATAPFKKRVKVGGGWNVYNQIIGADDLDNDGRADLLARTRDGGFYRYLSAGGGTFKKRTYFGGGGQNLSYYLGQGGVPAHGKRGLFTVDGAGTAFTHPAFANGVFGARKQVGEAGQYAYHWGTSTVHGMDGEDRGVLLSADSGGLWMEGNRISGSAAFRDYYTRLSVRDVTGDGRSDVLGLDPWGNLFLHPGLKYTMPTSVGAAVRIGTAWKTDTLVGTGDVTGDGRPDLVSRYDGRLYVHPGTGSATAPFGARVLVGTGWNGYEYLAAPGDMDGDGRSDLVAVTPGGDVYRYSATGLGGTSTFAARVKIASGWKYQHIS
ncbi:FG-GAP repeat domain-containing protein [Streptomyces sp. NPDC101490]|uniref:FG-GAP repeat domain-containing protein n=1 Tax=Streptomyces sp. NPDC101490 TaxID=3366143 RepID=UPI00382E145F